MLDDEYDKRHERPVSRGWATMFASSIFALFWTQKMNKTGSWLLICVFPQILLLLLLLFTGIPYILIICCVMLIHPIYFMHKWCEQYNLKTFGYKRRRDWYRSNDDEAPTS